MAEGAGKIVVVVGAGSKHDGGSSSQFGVGGEAEMPPESRYGLGGALGMPFAKAGYHVALLGRRLPVLEEVKKQVEQVAAAGSQCWAIQCDITKEDEVMKSAQDIERTFPQGSVVDCVIFNAAAPFPPGFSFGEDCLQPHQLDVANMLSQYDLLVGGMIRVSA